MGRYIYNNQLYWYDDMGGATDPQQYTRVEDYMRSIPWQCVLEKVYI